MDSIRHQEAWMPSEAQWSEFTRDLSPTDPTNEIHFNKIAVLARHYYKTGTRCLLYCIDLSSACKENDNSIQPLQPILELKEIYDSFHCYTRVVVGSELYLIGGFRKGWTGNWCYYDLRKVVDSPTLTIIEKQDLQSGEPMKGRKCEPVAAVVGGNKICVFATVLYDKKNVECKYSLFEPPYFEVYDTVEERWAELPEPAEYSTYELDNISIQSYCIDRSCLIIWTDIGIYGIKACDPEADWVEMKGTIERGPLSGRWELVGNGTVYMCNPFEVVRMGEKRSHPLAFRNKEGSLFPDDGLGVLRSQRVGDDVFLCVVQGTFVDKAILGNGNGTRTGAPALTPVLLVNVVKFDTMVLENMTSDRWNTIRVICLPILQLNLLRIFTVWN